MTSVKTIARTAGKTAGKTGRTAGKTLRCRLLLVAVACVLSTLVVAGVSLVVVFEKHLLEMIGKDLDFRFSDLARDVALDAGGEPRLLEHKRDSRYDTPGSGAYWQLSENNVALLRSPSLDGRDLDLREGGAKRAAGEWFEVDASDGHELYVVEREVTLGPADDRRRFMLAIALDHEQIAAARRAFEWDLAIVLGLIALVLTAAAALQLRVILQPLTRLGSELGAIRDGRRARFEATAPAEVAPLVDDFNRLLEEQERMVKKARERAGALAHGLKTPLAVLTAECRRLETEGLGEIAKRLREQVGGIQTHVERELARARTQGASAALGACVDVAKTGDRLVRVMSRMPRGEALSWRCEVPDDLMLRIDPDDFGEIVANLLDNARKWASTCVTLRCEASDGQARVIVEDDGPGFGANAAPPSLTAGDRENSAGLGLVIVQDILAAYGSSLWIDRAAAQGMVSFCLRGKFANDERFEERVENVADGRSRKTFSTPLPLGGPAQSTR